MARNILVTGGAGYTGSVLVRLLLRDNYNVIVTDNLTFGGESLLGVWHHPNFRFIRGDITSSKLLKSIVGSDKIDAIVHLAAIVGDPACEKHPKLAKRVNLDGSVNLLELSMKYQVKRFIFASTCSNYGKMNDPDVFVDEGSPLAPVSLYAELKVRMENIMLQEIDHIDGFSPTSLRFSTVYGISPRMRFDLTVNEFTKELAMGRKLEVYGERFWRPYCHVYDYGRAVLHLLKCDRDKMAYQTFNVGDTDENYQKQMIVKEIRKIIRRGKVSYVPKDEDPRDYRVSFEKIKRELGFAITRKIPDGIKEIKEMIDNRVLHDPDDPRYRNI